MVMKKDRRQGIASVVNASRVLFILLGLIWLGFGLLSILRIQDASSRVPIAILWAIAILMFINAILLAWVGWGIGRGNNLYYYFGLLLLAGNILLTFTDEFGFFDLLTLLINTALLVLLIAGRSKFFQN
jgi:hypothetical protein